MIVGSQWFDPKENQLQPELIEHFVSIRPVKRTMPTRLLPTKVRFWTVDVSLINRISNEHFWRALMDIAYQNLRSSFPPYLPPPEFSPTSGFKLTKKLHFPIMISTNCRRNEFKSSSYRVRNSSLMLQYTAPENDGNGDENFKSFGHWVHVPLSLFPGVSSSWWNLTEDKQVLIGAAKPITVYLALRRMWKLVWDSNRWVLLVAFGALTMAAVRVITKYRITPFSAYLYMVFSGFFEHLRSKKLVLSNSLFKRSTLVPRHWIQCLNIVLIYASSADRIGSWGFLPL